MLWRAPWQRVDHSYERLATHRPPAEVPRPLQRGESALGPTAAGRRRPLTPQNVYEKGLAVQLPRWQNWEVATRKKLDQMLHPEAA